MFLPHTFEVKDLPIIKAFMLSHSFAQLITNINGIPFASHVPLLLDQVGKHGRLLGHVAKANNQWRAFDGKADSLIIFSGPHAYISPSWYANENLVPTWNYVSVHAYGKPNIISNPTDTVEVMRKLTDFNESNDTGNWSMDNLNKGFITNKIKGIVTFEIPIDRVEGKFKLSQNRELKDRRGAIQGLLDTGDSEAGKVAQLMINSLPDQF